MAWEPLPTGEGANPLIRRLKAIDAEIYGAIYANSGAIGGDFTISGDLTVTGDIDMSGDFYSSDWDGTVPLSLPDSAATAGFALDGSAGDAQYEGDVWVGGYLFVSSDMVLDGGSFRSTLLGGVSEGGIVIDSNYDWNEISFYTGHSTEYAAGFIKGSQASPLSLTLASPDPNTGFDGKSTITLMSDSGSGTTKGTVMMETQSTTLEVGTQQTYSQTGVYGPTSNVGEWFLQSDYVGNASYPSYSFWGDGDTGMYRYEANVWAISAGGTPSIVGSSTHFGGGAWTTGVGLVKVGAGTAAGPAFAFFNDNDTGMYRYGTNEIGFSCGTTAAFAISANHIYGPVTLAPAMRSRAGSASTPDYSWVDDLDTGMYRYSANGIGWGIAGNLGMVLSSAKDLFIGTVSDPGHAYIKGSAAGSAPTPTYSFTNDVNTGMYRYGVDSIGWATGSTYAMNLDASQILRVQGAGIAFEGTNGTGAANTIGIKWSSPNIYARIDNAAEAVIGTVSDPRLKADKQPLVGALDRVLALGPIEFYPKDFDGTVDETQRLAGLDASEVQRVEPWLVTGEGDEYLSLNYLGMVPMLVGAVQELAVRVEELEGIVAKINKLEEEVRELKSGNN